MNKFIIMGGISSTEISKVLRSVPDPNNTKIVIVTDIFQLENDIELVVKNIQSDKVNVLTPYDIDLLKSKASKKI